MFDWSQYYSTMISNLEQLNDKVELLFFIVLAISFSNLMYFILNKKWVNK